MFDNMKKFMNKFESACDCANHSYGELTNEEKYTFEYADLHLAEALMEDWGNAETVAKIILAAKN